MKNNGRDIWRVSGTLIGIALALAVSSLFVKGAVTQPPVGSWNAGANLSQARAGASAALLQDGRILVTGGDNGSGPTSSADFINTDGTISAAPPMLDARENHISVPLANGDVLVAGGTITGGGATNAAEIFDPTTNIWTSVAGGMIESRSGATATLLQNGEVLIAGGSGNGAISSTAEIFDPNSPTDGNPDAFTFAGNLSSPRENLAAALLNDGRVLIVGGSNGSAPLATSDIYNPSKGTMSAGPAMPIARQGLSATTLLNGLVLIAGGSTVGNNGQATDLASIELFDPSANAGAGAFGAALDSNGNPVSLITARQGQQAVLLPHNGAVLIFGGTSSGATLASAELFTPSVSSTGAWSYADAATGSMTASRSNFAASSFSSGTPKSIDDGILFAAGGSSTNGHGKVTDLSSTDVYGFPWVKTDQSDYAPGSTASITGGGFQPGEAVVLSFVESPQIDNDGPVTATADSNGNIAASFYVDAQDAGVLFYMTAVGQSSGRLAQTTFTDANATTTTVNCVPTTVGVGQATVCTATVTPNTSQANVAGWVQWSSSNGGAFSAETGYTFNDPTGPAFPNCLLVTSSSPSKGVCAVQFTPANTGAQSITATFYSFSQGKLTSGSSGSVTIEVAPTLVLCAPTPNPVLEGSTGPVTLEATLSASASATCPSSTTTDALAGQTITFTVDGSTVGTATTDADGNATITTYDPSSLTAGDHTVQASFAGGTIGSTLYTSATSNTETLTVLAYASVNFSSSGLPSGVSVGASATSYTNPDNTTGGATPETFSAPGPSSSITTKPATSVSFSFPTSLSNSSITYVLTAFSCNGASCSSADIAAGTGSFTDGAYGTTQTVTATYVGQGKIQIVKDTSAGSGDGTFGFSLRGPNGYSKLASIATSSGTGQLPSPLTVAADSGYSVTENVPTNWSLASVSCSNGTSVVNTTNGGSFAVAAGQTVTCTFTDTGEGYVQIVKDTSAGSGDGTFPFNVSGPNGYSEPASIATSSGTGQLPSPLTVAAGSGYSVTENVPANWSLASVSCSNGTSVVNTTNGGSFAVATGQTVTCTFTDTGQGYIQIVKDTTGGDDTFGFNLSGPNMYSNTASITTHSGTGQLASALAVTAGTGYSVSETVPTGWSLTSSACDSGSPTSFAVTTGGTVTCTFHDLKLATIVLVKDTVGGNGTFSFTATGGLSPSPITTSSGTGSDMFPDLTPGTSGYSFTETVPTGWEGNIADVGCAVTAPGAGGTTFNTSGATTGTVAAGGTVTSPLIDNIGAGAVVTCTFTNGTLPTLTVVKDIHGTAATFFFNLNSGSTGGSAKNFPADGISVAANGTGQYEEPIPTGQQTITELLDQTVAAVGGWTLTDAQCTGASGGSSVSLPSATFTANYGDNVVCTFINSNVKTTRTQGFWATHTELSNDIWNGTPLPPGTTSIPSYPVVGTGDQLLCGVPITAVAATEENQLIGGFWLQPAKTTTGQRRLKIDHDRVLMLQQYLAAVLNFHAFGGVPPGGLAPYAADYCSENDRAIRSDIGILDTFNSQGDTNQFTPGSSATPRTSQAQADLDYWDYPAVPGSADESANSPSLTLIKYVSGGTASAADFTLTATCTTSAACGSAGTGGVVSGAGGFNNVAVPVGTYSLTDAGNDANATGYSAGSWACTNSGSAGASGGFLLTNGSPGTATLSIDVGAGELSCFITNSLP